MSARGRQVTHYSQCTTARWSASVCVAAISGISYTDSSRDRLMLCGVVCEFVKQWTI